MFSPNPAKKPLKSCMKKCFSSSPLEYKNISTASSSCSVSTDFSQSSCDDSMDSPLSSSVFSSHSTVSPDYITAYGTITPSMQSVTLNKSLSDLDISKSHKMVTETEVKTTLHTSTNKYYQEDSSDDTLETQFDCESDDNTNDNASDYPYCSYSYEPRVFATLCDEIEQDNRGRTLRREQKRYSYQQLCQLREQLELLERARISGLKGGPLDLHDVRDMIDKMREV